jgi:hypothetical protein
MGKGKTGMASVGISRRSFNGFEDRGLLIPRIRKIPFHMDI